MDFSLLRSILLQKTVLLHLQFCFERHLNEVRQQGWQRESYALHETSFHLQTQLAPYQKTLSVSSRFLKNIVSILYPVELINTNIF